MSLVLFTAVPAFDFVVTELWRTPRAGRVAQAESRRVARHCHKLLARLTVDAAIAARDDVDLDAVCALIRS